MAHSDQARKRIRQNEARRLINKSVRSTLRTQLKKFRLAVEAGNAEAAETELRAATKLVDKAVKGNLIHKNNGARKKSQMNRALNALKAG